MRVSRGRGTVSGSKGKVSTSSIEKKVSNGHRNIEHSEDKKVYKEEVNLESPVTSNLETKKVETKTENTTLETEKKRFRKSKRKGKVKKPKKLPLKEDLGKLGKGRVAKIVLVGVVGSTLLGGITYGLYYNQIMYPSEMVRDIESSGLGAIREWESAIRDLNNGTLKGVIGEDSFLAKEIEYANDNENKIGFLKKMVSTVSYEPSKIEALNKYGNLMIDRNDEVVYTDSLVNGEKEEVTLKYTDYSKLEFDVEKVKALMEEEELKISDVDYANRLVNVFCKYMVGLKDEEIPLKEEKHIPLMVKVGDHYVMTIEEDIYLDKLLFSSKEFYDTLDRFSVAAASGSESKEWVEWSSKTEEEKAKLEEPERFSSSLKPTKEWTEWNSKSEEEKTKLEEPVKYVGKSVISKVWCGSYYLMNEHTTSSGEKVSISAEVGDGTLKDPAGLNTSVVTSIFVREDDGNGGTKRVAKPIRIKLIDYKVSQDAIDYFESKEERNRGYDIKSEVQYASYTFEVTNLSNEELVIYDDSSLADKLANMSPRTGTVYGLQDSVTLKPDETGIIESWGASTELHTKYLVWGNDFNRETPVVWFRVLAGNLEDTSEYKGVAVNDTRHKEDEE